MLLSKESVITFSLMLVIVLLSGFYVYQNIFTASVAEDAPLRNALVSDQETEAFTDLDGNEVSLDDDFGKIIIVYSWASWCPQCATDLPQFDSLSSEFASTGVSFIAMNRAETIQMSELFLSSLPALSNLRIVLDPTDHLFENIGGYTVPEIVIFDREGEEVYHSRGVFSKNEVRDTLNSEL